MIIKKLIDRQKQWMDTPAERPMTNKEGLILTTYLMGVGFWYGYQIAKWKAEEEKEYVDYEVGTDPETGEELAVTWKFKGTETYLIKKFKVFGHEFKYHKRVRTL